MAAEDYFDVYSYEEEEEEPEGRQPNDVTCNRCGEEHLDWVHTGERWRLLNSNGTFHTCQASADDFEDLA